MAIAFGNNTQCKSKMKQINLNSGWVRELRDSDVVRLVRIPGKDNPADCLIKVLNGPAFIMWQSYLKNSKT
jgi:hypothetical protein